MRKALLVFAIILLMSIGLCGCSSEASSSANTSSNMESEKIVESFGAEYNGFFTNLVVAGEAPVAEDFKATLFYTNNKSEDVTGFTIVPDTFAPIGEGEKN